MRNLSFVLLVFLVDSASAQPEYRVQFQTMNCKLYLGYDNLMRVTLQHPDTNRYHLHATAIGATLDYDTDGRLHVLPTLEHGSIRFYAEQGGKYYSVKGGIDFEAISPPPLTDGTFIEIMGITKEDSKTSIKSPKTFTLPNGTPLIDGVFHFDGLPFSSLSSEDTNLLTVQVFKRGPVYYTPTTADVEMSSLDADIKKVDKNLFIIATHKGIKKCRFTVASGKQKISEEVLDVSYPIR